MHVTLIKPEISGKHQHYYVNALKIEPLAIANVAGLLPEDVEVYFFDDRYEKINYNIKTDGWGLLSIPIRQNVTPLLTKIINSSNC